MQTIAARIRNAHQLAGHIARAAGKECTSSRYESKFERETFTFGDGSKIEIVKNRYVKVQP